LQDQDYWFKVYRYDFRYYSLHLPYTERLPDGYTLRHLIAEYYGMTSWMDAALGRMLAALDSAGLAENTIVVFTSDHGDNLGSHGLVQKGTPTEESIRIPLIVRAPGQPVPHVDAGQVAGLVDIAPTLLSLAGIDRPGHFHGRDLFGPGRGASSALDRAAFVEAGGCGIRTTEHLYVLPRRGPDRALELNPSHFFDMSADPYQLHNLAGSGEQTGAVAELDDRLRKWDAETPWMRNS
jgi:choline-sulfatase